MPSGWLGGFFQSLPGGAPAGGSAGGGDDGQVAGQVHTHPDYITLGSLGEPGAAWGVTPEGSYAFTGANYASDVQQVPVTHTPPYGEPPLHDENFGLAADGDDDNSEYSTATSMFIGSSTIAQERDAQHEWIHGTPWHGYDLEEWVNPINPGIPSLGPINVQDFQSAHTNAIPHNASAEQGWGLDPAILYARYPKVQNTNPYWSVGAFRRMGGLAWAVPGIPFGDVTQGNSQSYAAGRRRPSYTHGRLVDVPSSVPFSSTVPVYGNAGPVSILPDDPGGIYP